MSIMIVVAVLLLALPAAAALMTNRGELHAVTEASVPRTPVAHAERIVASRYARGIITAEEYEKVLAVLRR